MELNVDLQLQRLLYEILSLTMASTRSANNIIHLGRDKYDKLKHIIFCLVLFPPENRY